MFGFSVLAGVAGLVGTVHSHFALAAGETAMTDDDDEPWLDPKWDEGGRVHNWRRHVPDEVRQLWPHLAPGVRAVLYRWADELADQEEWD
jgi:hypothetical protein